MTTAKRAPTPRKKAVKVPGANEATPLDPTKQPPEHNTTDTPATIEEPPAPVFVVAETAKHAKGTVMGSHVLTDKGWIREEK